MDAKRNCSVNFTKKEIMEKKWEVGANDKERDKIINYLRQMKKIDEMYLLLTLILNIPEVAVC